jgi:3-oxoacyl-[acyl-carrier protein] reductase
MGRLDGKVAVITGAGSGIGKGVASKFLAEGASVVFGDLRAERVEQALAELRTAGPVHGLAGDVTDDAFCQVLVDVAVERFGGLDVSVANAGIVHRHPFLEHTRESWDRTLAINLSHVFVLSQRAARQMVKQGRGGVVLATASANGHVAEKEVAAYNAAKAGVVLLTQTMAIELAPYGIRACCVSPGYVGPTNLVVDGGGPVEYFDDMAAHVPLGRIARVEEIASLFCFLASDDASFISGESVIIDGAQLAEQR